MFIRDKIVCTDGPYQACITFFTLIILEVQGEVIILWFGLVGVIGGGALAATYDVSNLTSLVMMAPHSFEVDAILNSPLIQVLVIGTLVFVSQMLMTLLYAIETVAVGSLLQKSTYILFCYAFQVVIYKVSFACNMFFRKLFP